MLYKIDYSENRLTTVHLTIKACLCKRFKLCDISSQLSISEEHTPKLEQAAAGDISQTQKTTSQIEHSHTLIARNVADETSVERSQVLAPKSDELKSPKVTKIKEEKVASVRVPKDVGVSLIPAES